TFDLMVHDLNKFFNEVEFVINLDFNQRYSKRFINHALLQIRDVKQVGNCTYFVYDLKRSNIMRVQLSSFAKAYHPFPRRHFQHDLISYLKLKRFSSYIGIALLTITGGLDMALDLNYSLGCLMDDLWASELTVPNFSLAYG
ncbi:hypothetical protein Tco_0182780, partial [Tanacetum coccineum]